MRALRAGPEPVEQPIHTEPGQSWLSSAVTCVTAEKGSAKTRKPGRPWSASCSLNRSFSVGRRLALITKGVTDVFSGRAPASSEMPGSASYSWPDPMASPTTPTTRRAERLRATSALKDSSEEAYTCDVQCIAVCGAFTGFSSVRGDVHLRHGKDD